MTQAGLVFPLGAGEGLSGPGDAEPMSNTVSRNNIFPHLEDLVELDRHARRHGQRLRLRPL